MYVIITIRIGMFVYYMHGYGLTSYHKYTKNNDEGRNN